MNANLLVNGLHDQPLEAFVVSLSDSIGCVRWSERQSSNYLGERYYHTLILGIEVTAALVDDDEFKAFDFWLCLQPEPGCVGGYAFLEGVADCVARKLVQCGHEVMRPFDMGRTGGGGVVYRRNPDPNARPRERVLTEEI